MQGVEEGIQGTRDVQIMAANTNTDSASITNNGLNQGKVVELVSSKLGQIGRKWDKIGIFSNQIQFILAQRAKMY